MPKWIGGLRRGARKKAQNGQRVTVGREGESEGVLEEVLGGLIVELVGKVVKWGSYNLAK